MRWNPPLRPMTVRASLDAKVSDMGVKGELLTFVSISPLVFEDLETGILCKTFVCDWRSS